MANNTLENIRNYAASLQGEERQAFIDKFNSIKDDDSKVEILGSRISSLLGNDTPKPQFSTIQEAAAAMQQARQGQQAAESNVNNLDPLISLGRSAYNVSWPMSAIANKVINNGSPVPEATTSGGRLMQDASAFANPLVGMAVGYGAKQVGKAAGAIGKSVGTAYGRVKNSFTGPASADLQALIDKRSLEIGNNKKLLEELLLKNKTSLEQVGKKEVPRISADMGKAYGKGLNEILTKLEDPLTIGSVLKKDALPVANQEVIDILRPIVDRASKDPLIIKSPAFAKVSKMLDFYENGMKNSAGLVDGSTGRLLSTSAPEYADIKTLISQVRDIRSTMKLGNAPVAAEDYFATQFDGAVSKLLKTRVKGFSKLQEEYGPMANTRKVAYKIFKPLSDESSVDAFMRRIQNNTLKSSDEKLIKFLEDGGEIAGEKIKGVGNFSSEIKDLGNQLKQLKSGQEIKGLKAKLSQKAADEKFRNRLFTWVAASAGVSGGLLKARDVINR